MYSSFSIMPPLALDQENNRYNMLFQHAVLGMVVVCPQNGRFIDANPIYCEMLGYSKEELLLLDVKSITHPDDIVLHTHLADPDAPFHTLRLNRPIAHFQIEKRYFKKNGDILHAQVSITAIFDEDGNHIEDVGIVRDISQQVAAKETYFDLFDNSPDLIYVMDENATFITVNQSVVEKYGYPKEYAIGKTPDIFGAPDRNDMEKVAAHIQKAWEGEPQYFDWWSLTATGQIFPKELVIKRGKYFGKEVLIAIGRDISQRYEIEQKLQKANEEIANFIYHTSHDLRSPVASLQGLLQVMRYTNDPQELEMYMAMMEKQLQKMDNSIGEIIDYQKITNTEIHNTEINLKKLVEEVLEPLSFSEGYAAIEKNVQINLPNPVQSDKQRLTVILANLISNSIKYYDKNKTNSFIHISAQEKDTFVEIIVEDNGIGIAAEHHAHIFDMFYRATNDAKGTGLGLSIVKEALEKLGGSISLSAELGKGCKFTIKFPNLHRV